jgi:hypothetical protein
LRCELYVFRQAKRAKPLYRCAVVGSDCRATVGDGWWWVGDFV